MYRAGLRRAAVQGRYCARSGARPSFFVSAAIRMSSSLPPVIPPVSSALPSDSYQLLPEADKVGASEDALYDQQIRDVEAWWASDRYKGIKRPYTAHDVVSKRGSLLQTYPSSLMARKLFNLFEERAAKGEPVHTSKHVCFRAPRPAVNADIISSGCN